MYLQNLCDILKVVKGTIICIENGERKEYESGAEALKAYSKYYGVVGLMSEVIFTDELGLNLRNNIAHGLCEREDFDKNTAYLVFMMLLMITRFDWVAYGIAEKDKIEK